jgi:HK97 family phage major capsid protein
MSVTIIEDLRAKRKGLLDENRSLVATAEAADRDLTAEEASEFSKREADFDAITGRIERLEKLEGIAADSQRSNPAVQDVTPEERKVSADPVEQSELEVRAFEKMIRSKGDASRLNKEERAALQVGANDEGGYTVPKAFEKTLIESMREWGVVSGLARHITTAESGDLSIPTVATNATAAWEAEEASFDETEPTFGTVTLKAYKAGNYAKVSDELLHDSAFDILGFLARNLGEGIGQLTGAAYATGASNSTTTPRGLVTSATAGVTTAVNTGFTASELIDHYHTLTEPYRSNAVWIMRDSTVAIIRKFTEAVNGQFLWQPGLQAGSPDTLLGRPVYTDPNIAAVAATNRVAVFGDIERAYIVRDVEGLRVKVLNELFALNGQIGVRCDLRTDGAIYDAAAAKALVIKT